MYQVQCAAVLSWEHSESLLGTTFPTILFLLIVLYTTHSSRWNTRPCYLPFLTNYLPAAHQTITPGTLLLALLVHTTPPRFPDPRSLTDCLPEERAEKVEEAELSIFSSHNQQYNMYHSALIAAGLTDAKDLELEEVARQALKKLPSAEAVLLIGLVVKIFSSIEPGFTRPGFDNFNVPAEMLPKPLPQGKRPQKIVIFCHHSSVCMLLARLLSLLDTGFLNLFGGDTGDCADHIERWAHTPNVPIMFISLAM